MAPDPDHDIPDNDGPSPLDPEGNAPFGVGPFGEGPFGPRDEEGETPDTGPGSGSTILQRHKVDRLIGISRERYREYQAQWDREREEKRRKREARRKREEARKRRERAERVAGLNVRRAGEWAEATRRNLAALLNLDAERQARLDEINARMALSVEAQQLAQMQRHIQGMAQERYRQAVLEEENEVLELMMVA